MRKCVRSLRVRRVSSQRIRSADVSASIARGEKSPRFPSGVATIRSLPFIECPPEKDSRRGGNIERLDASGGLNGHWVLSQALGDALAFVAENQNAMRQVGRSLHVSRENRNAASEERVDGHLHDWNAEDRSCRGADGFRAVRVSAAGEEDNAGCVECRREADDRA